MAFGSEEEDEVVRDLAYVAERQVAIAVSAAGLEQANRNITKYQKEQDDLRRRLQSVTQSELEVPLDACHTIEELQRKSSSCPVLFTWDGERYRFITDFMGGGGLGFWIAPGEFAPPDPTEVVRIEPGALAPIAGELRLSVMEPMQEVAYIDRLALIAVDHPPGSTVVVVHRFVTTS